MENEDKNIVEIPRKNTISVLAIIIFILLVFLLIQFLVSDKTEPAGSLDLVICPKCSEKFVVRIKDISDNSDRSNFCPKCGNRVAYIFKCDDCDYEFPLLPNSLPPPPDLKTMGKFNYVLNQQKCPNCGSARTHQTPVPEQGKK